MLRWLKRLFESLFKAGYNTVIHDGVEHAGYLAFLSILAIFPFLILFTAIAGVIGEADIGIQFINRLLDNLPTDFVSTLVPRIQEITSGPPQSLLSVAIFGIVWTSSSILEALRTALNRAYRVTTPPPYFIRRLFSILQIIILTAAAIIAMFTIIIEPIANNYLVELGVQEEDITEYSDKIRYVIGVLILLLVVATSYFTLPNVKLKFFNVLPGAIVVVAAWLGAAELLSLYIHNFDQVNLVYGSMAGIIVTLLFFYVIGVIYIYGAEFNYLIERSFGHKIIEKEHAEAEEQIELDIAPPLKRSDKNDKN